MMIMIRIVILRVNKNRDNKRFTSKFQRAVLEKWIFENFRGTFNDDVIDKDIDKELNLMLVT